MTASKQEGSSGMMFPATIKEEQTSSDDSQMKQQPRTRRRASVACTSCRDRRIRCVVPTGKQTCMQCERSSTSCVIKNDDERRRPISRAYVCSLVGRIALLERLLEEQGLNVPPASHPPEIQHCPRRSQGTSSVEETRSSSSPSQEIYMSEGHAATSPHSFNDQITNEHSASRRRKRLSIQLEMDTENIPTTQRTRHDSIVAPVKTKCESPRTNPFSAVAHSDASYSIDQSAVLPFPYQAFLWSEPHNLTGSQTMVCSTVQIPETADCAYDAWGTRTFNFQSYNHCAMDQGSIHTEHQYAGVASRKKSALNLDFMPLSRGG